MKDLKQHLLSKGIISEKGCWLWQGATASAPGKPKYGRMTIDGHPIGIHRLAYELWVGVIPPGLNVCHKCDVTLCFNPEHLFVGTQGDNVRDAAQKGRLRTPVFQGSQHGRAKLMENRILEIRKLYDEGLTSVSDLARMFLVTRTQIRRIGLRQQWTHIPEKEKS